MTINKIPRLSLTKFPNFPLIPGLSRSVGTLRLHTALCVSYKLQSLYRSICNKSIEKWQGFDTGQNILLLHCSYRNIADKLEPWPAMKSTSNVTGRHRGPKRKRTFVCRYVAPPGECYVAPIIFHRRVWHCVISLCYACIQSSGIILIP